MALSDPHRNHLLDELSSSEAIDAAVSHGARSIDADEAHRMGFRYKGWRGGGLLLPFGGDFAQLRCDEPPVNRSGDPVKYLNRKGARQQPATFGDGKPTMATEGWKDALRLHLATGETVQAIPGVTARMLLAKSVRLLIYDADAALNPAVWGQLIRAGLERPGLRLGFFPREIAGDKGGACEFFNAGGDLATVQRWKARELLRELPRQWDRSLRVDWHAPAVRRLAVLALQAGLSRDAAKQLAEGAAKKIGLPVRRARQFLAAARRNAAPQRQPGRGAPVLRNDAPPERQTADLLYNELGRLVACYGGRLYLYDDAAGYWRVWPEAEAEAAALAVLRRLFSLDEDGSELFAYGTAHQMQAAVALLARIAGPGPLGDTPPQVVVLGNGTYNMQSRRMEPHSPDHGATYAIDADFIPGAACPAPLRRVIETCYPEGAEPIIRAEVRWLIDPTIRYGEAFHHLGGTGTGKGVLIEFLAGLVPPSLQSSVPHPADIADPEKLHQFVVGRRLVLFPDTPARHRNAGHCGLFYELIENKPQSPRRLHSSEAEPARPMHARCILGSVAPLQFGDSRDGFHRRVLTIQTLPRTGDPDPTLRSDLISNRQARSEAVSWALSMPVEEIEAVLDKNDPENLLRQSEAEAAAAGDSVSQWADACLVPHGNGPQAEVDDFALNQMFEAYVGYCRYAGFQHAMQRHNFVGQLRRLLGPRRCLPRRKESMAEVRARGGSAKADRQDLPRLDAGFALRAGVLLSGATGGHGDRSTFNRLALGSGGLAALATLPTALRHPPSDSPATPCSAAGGQQSEIPSGESDAADSSATPPVSQGCVAGVGRGVAGLSSSARSPACTGVLLNPEEVSHTSFDPPLQEDGMQPEGGRQGASVLVSPRTEKGHSDCPATPLEPLEPGDAVELWNAVLRVWQNGWRLAQGPDIEGLYEIKKDKGGRSQHVRRGALKRCSAGH